MVTKTYQSGCAGTNSVVMEDGYELAHLWPSINQRCLQELSKLPEELLLEIKSFAERNSLTVVASRIEDKEPLYSCCLKCLKAHILKKTNKKNPEESSGGFLDRIFGCGKVGHNGYYLDGGRLIRI